MTGDEVAAAAVRQAKALAARWGLRDYRDLVTGAWLGLARHPGAAGVAARVAAYRGVVDLLRAERADGLTRAARAVGRPRPVSLTEAVPPGCAAPPARPTLLSVWADYAPLRRGVPMALRVTAYLYFVEGLTQDGAAAALGIDKSAVCLRLARFEKLVRGET